MYACMHLCTYVCTYVCACMYLYVCVCMHVCMYVCMYLPMHACMSMQVSMHVRLYVCMYVCMICMYVYKYTYIYIAYVCFVYVLIYQPLWRRRTQHCTWSLDHSKTLGRLQFGCKGSLGSRQGFGVLGGWLTFAQGSLGWGGSFHAVVPRTAPRTKTRCLDKQTCL